MPTLGAHILVNEIINLFETLKIPIHLISNLIQFLHISLFLLFLYFVIFIEDKSILFILLILSLFILATQLYFQGCLISLLEKKLNRGNDIFKQFFKLQRTITGETSNDQILSMKWLFIALLILIVKLVF